jgi:hypothetical protein
MVEEAYAVGEKGTGNNTSVDVGTLLVTFM